ncbi:Glutamine--fructose-6-phosphate aminotransferase [isomerizing] [Usitatibacter rugosus]|uniref:Glutamine--fructose-6-phosphate aminotransferase [isomerizing] n=1 Tax=Usitatibacter rugosus TaxID=2732067 RepID=A0A6M4GX30_9PROT|nr:Glutamine--fructose-6-phosphate aminotransferase [isomerizing] [Usitatibacter rugosus]
MSDLSANAIDPGSTQLFQEAAQASDAVRLQFERTHSAALALGSALRTLKPRAVVTCARGSSDHAATFAKYLIETRTGVLTASAAPSVSSVYGARQDMRDVLFLAISQSGRSPDLVSATAAAKQAGALVVSLVNAEGSPLAEVSDYALPLCAGPETSVAATKSYIASLAAIVHLVAAWAQDDLLMDSLAVAPEQLRRSWDLDWSAAVPKLSAASSLFVVGRGVGLGIAQEAALKLKETSGLHAEAFSSAEVRHGPQALLKENFPALLFSQNDEAKEGVETLASDLAARGVDVMLAGASVEGVTVLPSVAAHPAIQPMLLVQSFYKLANAVAIARGFDPDRPPHLRKVTETL